ncbi:hypothetical protein PR202_ga02020 [Eleusine coracana subsp. coracana]|uniref:RRM domain-containing protein n=1 Tax=Eleusine coracana subsp. coracana TaxID=191504 RepID=A0AAV5BGL0_ELECO|nr:hypothetical protein PR202_ga01333 [Eleusine coracana subsp. coracana]GJM86187.1 hypothetical protein PR202_ga02020 [Eleusine coracana subsp. coracana]
MSTQSISPASASAQFTYPSAAAASIPSYFPVPFHLQNAQYTAWPAAAPAVPAVAPLPAYNAVYPMPQVQQLLLQLRPPSSSRVEAKAPASNRGRRLKRRQKRRGSQWLRRRGWGRCGVTVAGSGLRHGRGRGSWGRVAAQTVSRRLGPGRGADGVTAAGAASLQDAQQLFQQDSNIITPVALATVKAAIAKSEKGKKAASEATKKAVPRKAAGQSWEDPTLADWPENDFRLFCGDLGNEVNDDILTKAFSKYPSFNMARVIRDKWTGKTKGYGFVSFGNASELAAALKEMNGKYVGNRPIKLRKSTWKNRIDFEALEKAKTQPHKKVKVQKRSVLHK